MNEQINTKSIYYLGIGAFGFFALSSFSYLIGDIFENVLTVFNVDPFLNFWIGDIIGIIIFSIVGFFLFKRLEKRITDSENETKKLLRKTITLFIVSQIIVILFTFYGESFFYDNYIESFNKMSSFIIANPYLTIIKGFIGFSTYLIFGIFIYKSVKTVANTVYN